MAVETDIHRAILLKIGQESTIPIAWPNVAYNGPKPYAIVTIIPGQTVAYSMTTTNLYQGIIQFTVVVDEGVGQIKALLLAENFVSMFPRNSVIDFNGTRIRFNGPASLTGPKPLANQPIAHPQDGLYVLYISVPFIVLD